MSATNHPAGAPNTTASPSWRTVFATGLALWLASVVVTRVTGNVNLISTVVLLGSFLVPASAVIWYLDEYQSPELMPSLVIRAFIVGGVLGVLAASLLESWLLPNGPPAYLVVGPIEEGAKAAALVLIARGLLRYTVRDGVVLGASVGFGFAAFESSGYALHALVVQSGSTIGLSLTRLVFTELLRGVLAPVGHGLWTAILGGVLFRAWQDGRLRISRAVVATYLLISALHSLWDSMQGIAIVVTALLTGTQLQQLVSPSGELGQLTDAQATVMTLTVIVGLALVSAVGIMVLRRVWHTPTGDQSSELGHLSAASSSDASCT